MPLPSGAAELKGGTPLSASLRNGNEQNLPHGERHGGIAGRRLPSAGAGLDVPPWSAGFHAAGVLSLGGRIHDRNRTGRPRIDANTTTVNGTLLA
ncbi:MAG: hypothetical protein ACLT38_04740 [Akkermansia sp.]